MTDLTPVQQLQTARDLLVKLRDEADYSIMNGWLVSCANKCTCAGVDQCGLPAHERGCGYEPLTNDPVIVMLYATLGPQLDWLQDQLARMKADIGTGSREVHYRDALALAASILGAVQA